MAHTAPDAGSDVPGQAPGSAKPPETDHREIEPTLWAGWIIFGSMMMLMLGGFHLIQGLVALLRSEYFLVGRKGLTIDVSYTAWGWVHVFLGAVVMVTGFAVLFGQTWARVTGVVIAMASALVNVAFLAAYPLCSVMMIALDVIVIWALTVHGAEIRSARERAR